MVFRDAWQLQKTNLNLRKEATDRLRAEIEDTLQTKCCTARNINTRIPYRHARTLSTPQAAPTMQWSLRASTQELWRRFNVTASFGNDASYLRLAFAILMVFRDAWQLGKLHTHAKVMRTATEENAPIKRVLTMLIVYFGWAHVLLCSVVCR